MDSSFRSVIEILSENIPAGTESEMDTIQLELNQRTFEMELVTKRNQVDQLREEVDTLNQVNHDFKRDLTLANETIASLESELVILRKIVNDAELEAKNRSLVEKKFDQKILEIENSTLKELLQKSEMEKRKLQREKEDLLAQQNINSATMRELLEQDQKIRSVIDKYTMAFDEVDKQKDKVVELHKKLEEFQKSNHQMELLHEKLKDPTSKIKKLEKEHAFTKAKLNMLEELLQDYSLPQSESSTDIHTYYIEKAEELEHYLKAERELVLKQQERLNKEVTANTLLCNKLEDLEKQVEELEKKLARLDNRESVNLCD